MLLHNLAVPNTTSSSRTHESLVDLFVLLCLLVIIRNQLPVTGALGCSVLTDIRCLWARSTGTHSRQHALKTTMQPIE